MEDSYGNFIIQKLFVILKDENLKTKLLNRAENVVIAIKKKNVKKKWLKIISDMRANEGCNNTESMNKGNYLLSKSKILNQQKNISPEKNIDNNESTPIQSFPQNNIPPSFNAYHQSGNYYNPNLYSQSIQNPNQLVMNNYNYNMNMIYPNQLSGFNYGYGRPPQNFIDSSNQQMYGNYHYPQNTWNQKIPNNHNFNYASNDLPNKNKMFNYYKDGLNNQKNFYENSVSNK